MIRVTHTAAEWDSIVKDWRDGQGPECYWLCVKIDELTFHALYGTDEVTIELTEEEHDTLKAMLTESPMTLERWEAEHTEHIVPMTWQEAEAHAFNESERKLDKWKEEQHQEQM
jgi:hypothetical protein